MHVSRLPPPSSSESGRNVPQFTDPTVFADLLTVLKQSISTTLDASIRAQREESIKLASLRSVTGWNPVGFFGKIECLANTYESVGLYEESLRCFHEIDDMYKQCLLEGELTFFPSIAPTSLSQGEDSLSVLSPTVKPYRDMILHSSASLWELRKYLLARRLILLSKMGRGLAVMRETLSWLAEIRTMVQGQDLPPHCLAAFYISVSLDIVHHCLHLFLSPSGVLTAALPTPTFHETLEARNADLERLPPSFHALSGEMLCMAMKQLEAIGTSFEYLPSTEPFLSASRAREALKTREITGITREELLKALENETQFTNFYRSLANRTLVAMARGGRRRSKLEVQLALATLDMHQGKIDTAYQSFSGLIESQSEHNPQWSGIERLLLGRQLECHARLGKPANRAWVASVVNLLRSTSSSHDVAASDKHPTEGWDDDAAIFDKLRAASITFEREVPVSGFAKLAIIPGARRAKLLGDQDGIELPAVIFSSLQHRLAVDDVRFCLTGGDTHREQYWLTSGPLTLEPGRSEVTLRNYSAAPGKYALDVSQIRLGRIVFQYVSPKIVPSATSSSSAAAATTVITVPQDGDAIDVTLRQPALTALDQPRYAEVLVLSGRQKIEKANLFIKHQVDERPLMGFNAGELTTHSGSLAIKPTEDGLGVCLIDVPRATPCAIRFPLDEAPPSDGSAMQLLIEVDYVTAGTAPDSSHRPKRSFRKRVELATALPLGVNVQDFFRLDALVCKFSISTGGGSTLKVRKATLRHEDGLEDDVAITQKVDRGYKVTQSDTQSTTVVTPRQPAAYVFKIERTDNGDSSLTTAPPPAAGLRLAIVYRTLNEDAKRKILAIYHRRLGESTSASASSSQLSTSLQKLLEAAIGRLAEKNLNVPAFALTGAIRFSFSHLRSQDRDVSVASEEYWQDIASRQWGMSRAAPEMKGVLALIRDVLDEAARCKPQAEDDSVESGAREATSQWRTLEIPVEVPQMDIVNQVRLTLSSNVAVGQTEDTERVATVCIAGRPVKGRLSIESNFQWSPALWQQGIPASELDADSHRRSLAPPSSPGHGKATGADTDTDAGSVFEDAVSKAGSDTTERGVDGIKRHPEAPRAARQAAPAQRPPGRSQRMACEIQSDFENWIVAGTKRIVWNLRLPGPDGSASRQTETIDISLIPLRTGKLTMPNVAIWPLAEAPTSLPRSLAHGGRKQDSVARRGAEDDQEMQLPTCESYVLNAAERVTVVDVDAVVPPAAKPKTPIATTTKGKADGIEEKGEGYGDSDVLELEDVDVDEEEEEEPPRFQQGISAARQPYVHLPGETFWVPEVPLSRG